MTLLVDVLDEDGLKASDIVLFALPGVGDVGKNAIELLNEANNATCLLYTSPSPRDATLSRMPSSA